MNANAQEAMDAVDASIEDKLEALDINLDELQARHEGGLQYSVLSVRNGSPTYHYVTLGSEPDCTCEDFAYNKDDRDVCAHVVAANFAERLSVEETVAQEVLNKGGDVLQAARDAQQAADKAEAVADELDTGLARLRDAQAAPAEPADTSDSDTTDDEPDRDTGAVPEDVDAAEAADKLQEAYDDVVEDMQVQHSAGVVWIQTGRDTPEEIENSGPGPNVDVWDWLIGDPEQVNYIHEEHDLYDDKPGEWWKNSLTPDDVDSYIDEVLDS